jgi:hypothetical protein
MIYIKNIKIIKCNVSNLLYGKYIFRMIELLYWINSIFNVVIDERMIGKICYINEYNLIFVELINKNESLLLSL